MSRFGNPVLVIEGQRFRKVQRHTEKPRILGRDTWLCIKSDNGCKCYAVTQYGHIVAMGFSHEHHAKKRKRQGRIIKQSSLKNISRKPMKMKPQRIKNARPNPVVNKAILNGMSFSDGDSLNSELGRLALYFNQ